MATDDGGRCWTTRAGPSPAFHAVHFVDPDVGWGVADDPGGMLIRTTNGGRTGAAPAAPARVQSVCFTDARRGWLVAGGVLLGTEDGGGRWTQVALEHRGDEPWPTADVECTPGVAWVLATDGAAVGHIAHALYRVPTGPPAQAVMGRGIHPSPRRAPASRERRPPPIRRQRRTSSLRWPAGLGDRAAPRSDRAAGRSQNGQEGGLAGEERGRETGDDRVRRAHGTERAGVRGPGNASRQGAGLIVRTTDGGRTWAVQYRTS